MQEQLHNQDALYAAFQHEAVPHLDSLYVTALRLTRDPSDAEDLVQEAMLKAYRYFDKYEQGTNCKAWLFKILTNVFINRYNKRRASKEVLDDEQGRPLEERVAAPAVHPFVDQILDEQTLYHKFFADEVKNALEAMPDEYRLVVLLADLQDFAYKEIADIMGCPIGTVMSRLYRGRKMLQASLATYAAAHGYAQAQPAQEPSQEQVKPKAKAKAKDLADAKVQDLQEYRRRKQVG